MKPKQINDDQLEIICSKANPIDFHIEFSKFQDELRERCRRMNSNEYRKLARRTMNFNLTEREQLAMLGLGLGGEAGEVVDLIKKVAFHGHDMDREKLIKEAGDIMWYLEMLLDYVGITMSEVYEKNIQKLNERYPNGFSEEASRRRGA